MEKWDGVVQVYSQQIEVSRYLSTVHRQLSISLEFSHSP